MNNSTYLQRIPSKTSRKEERKGKYNFVSRLAANAILGNFHLNASCLGWKEGKHPEEKLEESKREDSLHLISSRKNVLIRLLNAVLSSLRPNCLCCCSSCVVPSANCKHLTRLFDELSIKEISFARCAAGGCSEKSFIFPKQEIEDWFYRSLNQSAWRRFASRPEAAIQENIKRRENFAIARKKNCINRASSLSLF